ncbi:hypothetical protein BDR26DRAFT_479212 [Obelidium mucronatum]|nr:hypothetical protein BDR26DRAFT_479212 [Obelidium mucronatum]
MGASPSKTTKRANKPFKPSESFLVLMDLPDELIAAIFSWIHPLQAPQYRLLSTRVSNCLNSKSFAMSNLLKCRQICLPNPLLMVDAHTPKVEALLVRGNSNYQEATISLTAKSLGVIHVYAADYEKWSPSTIPIGIGDLQHLTLLTISRVNLTGTIPDGICDLTNLEGLYLQNNALVGPIPKNIGNLVLLKELWLFGNQLNGPIPASVGNLVNVVSLHFNGNQLTGPIPSEIGGLRQVERLYLSENDLSGSLPAEIGNLQSVKRLGLGTNALSGLIPKSLLNLKTLEYLNLNENGFLRPLPEGFDGWVSGQGVDLGVDAIHRGRANWFFDRNYSNPYHSDDEPISIQSSPPSLFGGDGPGFPLSPAGFPHLPLGFLLPPPPGLATNAMPAQ